MTDRAAEIEEPKDAVEIGGAPGMLESAPIIAREAEERPHPLDVSKGCLPGHPEYLTAYVPAVGDEVIVPCVTPQDQFLDTSDRVTEVLVIDGEAYVRLQRTPGLMHHNFVRSTRALLSEFAVILRAHGVIWAVPMRIDDKDSRALNVMMMSGAVERQVQLETLSDGIDELLAAVEERTGSAAIRGTFSFAPRPDLTLDLAYVRYFEPTTKRALRNAERAVRAHLTRQKNEPLH